MLVSVIIICKENIVFDKYIVQYTEYSTVQNQKRNREQMRNIFSINMYWCTKITFGFVELICTWPVHQTLSIWCTVKIY